ncbi:MAG: MBL fold metallo-hydrolase [Anaerolineae bacterium]|jgi:glyoxylase-like metal-dependent hydrolase (beta-lactamase superfamily II)|nr:MBL fold metallo-hydrolase [Anaerolineae bacterium]MBT7072026.1 MBL fold metallo-hydrolase [Anaerolineae bacterium]MBT7324022.1 MBL fold metallo-hydrolase [Anaerolineae bacterium]
MQSLKENIHIEDKYSGVTLGAINLPRGLIYIDAPPIPEDGRSWRADLLDLESGYERLLINLDSNVDRTIGARAMDCSVLVHEETAGFFRNHPGAFKSQSESTGAEWEVLPNLGNIRWAPPRITFTKKMSLYWGESPIYLEHHPGSSSGAIWIVLPDEKVVFVGDAVLKNQPPFLASADLPRWINDLKLLSGEEYKGYSVISGRGGVCASSTIDKQRELLQIAHKKLESLAAKGAAPEDTAKIIPALLAPFRFLASEREAYTQRLRYGLQKYYILHYIPELSDDE